jgi:hypothetical protein
MLLNVGFTKNPRHPAKAEINTTVETVSNSEFRPEFEIIPKPRNVPLCRRLARGVLPIVADEIFALFTPKDMN